MVLLPIWGLLSCWLHAFSYMPPFHNREIGDLLAGDRENTASVHLHAGEDGDGGSASGSRLLTEYRYALLEAFEDVFDLKLQVRG